MRLEDPIDPSAPQEPEPQPEPQPTPEPEPAPQYDLESAYNVIAQHEGWDPRLTKYEVQEQRRRKEELDRRERELQQRETRRYEPPEDNSDPYMRRISNIERALEEDRNERRAVRDRQETERRIEHELQSAFVQAARQNGFTPEQMEQRTRDFYGALADVYPEYEMIQKVGVERAARVAFGMISRNGPRTTPNVQGRGPTAVRTIPGSPQPYMQNGTPQPLEENMNAEQGPEETDEQYLARLERIITGANLRRLPDGAKVQSRQ